MTLCFLQYSAAMSSISPVVTPGATAAAQRSRTSAPMRHASRMSAISAFDFMSTFTKRYCIAALNASAFFSGPWSPSIFLRSPVAS